MATGRGLSNRTLGRLAVLSDEGAAASGRAFVLAMERAGCSRRRINKAYALALPPKPQAIARPAHVTAFLAIARAAQSHSHVPLPALCLMMVVLGWAVGPVAVVCVAAYSIFKVLTEDR